MSLGLLVTSALINAIPVNSPVSWLSDLNYPTEALKQRAEGTVNFRLLITPNGEISRCEITRSANSTALDTATCYLFMTRLKFKPAIDETGNSSYAFYNGSLSWTLPGHKPPARTPPVNDLVLNVLKLPDGDREQTVYLNVRLDQTGHIVACELNERSRKATKLADVACTQAESLFVEITKDKDDTPISLVRSIGILFKVAE